MLHTIQFDKPEKRLNFKAKWIGECISPIEGLSLGAVYEVVEEVNSDAPLRPVQVVNDYGKTVTVFAARFVEHREPGEFL
jgi:hypothetical protein